MRLEAPSGLEGAEVRDLSASGGGLVLPADRAEEIAGAPFVFEPEGFAPFSTRLVPVRTDRDSALARVGVVFESLDRSALESLSLFLIDRFREESRQVKRLLAAVGLSMASFRRDMVVRLLARYAVSLGQPIRVYAGDACIPVRLRARTITVEAARQVIVAEVLSGSPEMIPCGEDFVFTFLGFNAVNHFTSAVWRSGANTVVILMPPEIRQVGFRDSPRIRPLRPVSVSFDHPRLGGLRLEKTVVDVSSRGLSFFLDPRADVLFPGERLGRIRLDLPHGRVQADAAIRSIVPQEGSDALACGLQILRFADAREAEIWRSFVFHEGHPRLEMGRGDLVEQAWEALRSSGYVDLLEESERTRMEARFVEAWKGISPSANVSRFLLLRKDDRPVGTAAASLLYPRTWMAHHFGIDVEERQSSANLFDVAREIYSGTMFMLQHMAPLDAFVFFFDAAKPWHDLFFGQFIQRYRRKGDMLYDGFTLYKRIVEDEIECAIPFRPTIVRDDPDLMRLLSRHLASTLSPLECDAFCYAEDEISLDPFSAACEEQGYERTRSIYFAVQGDQVLAALVAETGREGVNVFSLLDRCWLVVIDPDLGDDIYVRAALLAEAATHYAGRNKRSFLFFAPPDGDPDGLPVELGFTYVAQGRRWLALQEVIPAYLSYMEEVIGG
ncbi:MAG: PilZ domain-containing protein, partial [Deltaproteobacteria bacterium]|nr:PilZ domain-containing protein [Deltaproteobacteria bacterium]